MKKRRIYKYTILLVDFISLLLIFPLSNLLDNGTNSQILRENFMLIAALFTTIKVIGHYIAGDYDLLWMYRTKHSYLKMLFVTSINTIVIAIIYCIFWACWIRDIDPSTMVIVVLFEFFYVFVSRFIVNIFLEMFHNKNIVPSSMKRTLIVGAGAAGNMVLNEIGLKKEYGYSIIAFIDDSVDKVGSKINNVKVYGPISSINSIIERLQIEEIIIAMPTAGHLRIREIVNIIDYKNVSVHIVPDTSRILQDNITESLRKVSISDLLGREAVRLDTEGLSTFLGGKTILVTGGGGSIGSEICRQVLRYGIKQLVIFDIYENTTYDLIMELAIKYKDVENKPIIIPLIGSVRDEKRLDEVFAKYCPNIIFHAAAHKHVPLMEDSPKEAIKNNVVGTYNVAKYADKYGVEKMVMISTDKAVNPTNVMGTTKRFAEMVIESWQNKSANTKYSMVRFGNVLGSNGSVIPLFERQIQNGGPVTVTSSEITRFFMTIPEACSLVIQAGAYAQGGEKFILDMGEPVKIIDLAKKMIKLSGYEIEDIGIEITGLRPGEKLYEELLLSTVRATKTENDKIFVEKSSKIFTLQEIDEIIARLKNTKFTKNSDIIDYLKEVEVMKTEKGRTGENK